MKNFLIKKNGISDPNTVFNNEKHVSLIEAPKNYTTGRETIDYNTVTSSEVELDDKTLSKIAWGIIIKPSEDWELIGNRQLWEDFKAGKDTGHPIGRYWLKDDGTARKCDPNDSTKFLDGSPVPNDEGQIMVYLPTLYFLNKTDEETGYHTLWMSNRDLGGPVIKESMIGAFLSTNYDGKAYSRISDDIGEDWSMVKGYERLQAVGPYFNNMDYDQWRYIMMLHMSEFGTSDIQTTIGTGQTDFDFVGKTSKWGDKTCYLVTDGSVEQPDKEYEGIQNFLGLEGLIHRYVFCGGLLSDLTGIYLYKDPTKLYINKEDILKLNNSNYRLIPIDTLARDFPGPYIGNIIGGNYFDIFPQYGKLRNLESKFNDAYNYSNIEESHPIAVFGNGYSLDYGLAYAKSISSFDEGVYGVAVRCGYFGQINFIN